MNVTFLYGAGADKSLWNNAFLGGRFLVEALKYLDNAFDDEGYKENALWIGSNRYRFEWKKYVRNMLQQKLELKHGSLLKGLKNHSLEIRKDFSVEVELKIWEQFVAKNSSLRFKQLVFLAILHTAGVSQINRLRESIVQDVRKSLEDELPDNIGGLLDYAQLHINIDPSRDFIDLCIKIISEYMQNDSVKNEEIELVTDLLDYSQLIDEQYKTIVDYRPQYDTRDTTKGSVLRSLHFIYSLMYAIEAIEEKKPEVVNYYAVIESVKKDHKFHHITLNYTRYVGNQFPKTNYIHGKLGEYLNLDNREIINTHLQSSIPNIVPQTTIKPLVSFEMIKRYSDAFYNFMDSDLLISVGFGFQRDDSHIIDIIRKALKENGKLKLIVYAGADVIINTILEQMKLEFGSRIELYDFSKTNFETLLLRYLG